jgi:hypothetical protein
MISKQNEHAKSCKQAASREDCIDESYVSNRAISTFDVQSMNTEHNSNNARKLPGGPTASEKIFGGSVPHVITVLIRPSGEKAKSGGADAMGVLSFLGLWTTASVLVCH